ncbi:MAG: LptF/LptG family permease [Hyphomicrobiales bacterium]
MTIVGWLLTRMILFRFVGILFVLSFFVITLEVFTLVGDILELKNGDPSAVLQYAWLLLPGTLSTFLPVSALLAILLTLVELSIKNELPAIWAAGVSPLRVVMMLLPVGLLLGGLHFLLNDQLAPRVETQLATWGIGEHGRKKLIVGEHDPIWLRAGNDIMRAGTSNTDSSLLQDVIIFRRSDQGLLQEQIMAAKATLEPNGRWLLEDVVVYYADAAAPHRLDRLIYSGSMRPAAQGMRSGDPEEMTTADLGYFIANEGFGIRPAYVYETWWHRRISLLVTAWLMIAICIPLSARFRRGGAAGYLFVIGMAIGFTFSIFDGISLTMGEAGFVPPWIAGWIPVIAYAILAVAIALRAETVQ